MFAMLTALMQNNINFTSIPVYKDVRLKSASGEVINAVVSRLNPKDGQDRRAIEEIKKSWSKDTAFDIFCRDFLDSKNTCEYYAIELKDGSSLGEKIVGLAQIIQFRLVSIKTKSNSGLKGAGENLLGRMFERIAGNGYSNLTFASINNGFYSHVFGTEHANMFLGGDYMAEICNYYSLEKQYIIFKSGVDKFINYLKGKYGGEFHEK